MAKWYGKIGFETTTQISPGIYEEVITERNYYGDVTRSSRRINASGTINSDVTISNQISIIGDPYARENIYSIRYAQFQGTKWTVSDVEVQYPRLLLTLGGIYNV